MLDFLKQLWVDLQQFLYSLVLTLFDLLKDILFFFVEGLMSLTLIALEGMAGAFDGFNFAQYVSSIPSGTAYFLSSSGISEATGMIITSLGIRFLLQLIPFTRLGS